jgi:ADP-ribose pyrophosphatase YjhB (NUDIX family)
MRLNAAVYDLWVFRRSGTRIEFLLLRTSQQKADRYFSGGRFWQIPSGVFGAEESVPDAVDRELATYGLRARAVWAGEHVYTIYNRRFHEIQIISVFAVQVDPDVGAVQLNPDEHSDYQWVSYDTARSRVHYRGLKDGLRSVQEYITGVSDPAPELRLR